MKAILTVVGRDKVGIIAGVTEILAKYSVNILDINQTIMQDSIFTMIMIADLTKSPISFEDIQNHLNKKAEEMGVTIKLQHEGVFNAMSEI
ncbi:MAG: ACT domain-containing protein [Anaerovoracaceae bacterium]